MEDFIVDTDIAGSILVPAGFMCDLNSIPRFLWWASTPADYAEAGVVHDWAYRGNLPRDKADEVYRELLITLGMSHKRADLRYAALRYLGWRAYVAHSQTNADSTD